MKIRPLLLASAAVLGFGLLPNASYAANTHVQNATPAHGTTTFESSKTTTFPAAVGPGDHVMGFVSCYNLGAPPTVQSIKDNNGISYNIADNFIGVSTSGTPTYRAASYYLLNINGGPTSITVTWSAPCQFSNIVAEEFSGSLQAAAPIHAAQGQISVPASTDNITSTNGTASLAGSLAYGVTMSGGSIADTAGTGWTASISDATAGTDYTYTQYRLAQAQGSLASTFTSTGTSFANMTALMIFSPPAALPTPVSAVCNQAGSQPNSPTLPDSSLANAVACSYVVTMSDMSTTFTGNVLEAQQGCTTSCLFSLSSNTGNGNLILARNAAVTDDGTQVALLNFHQNGVTYPLTVNLAVTASTAAGNPEALGWKGINPNGSVIFTAHRAMTVNAITGVVTTPAGGPAFVDVYKVPGSQGLACTSGTKLHSNDFNANGAVDINQPLALISTALNIGDDVCVVTSGTQWGVTPVVSAGTITLTVN